MDWPTELTEDEFYVKSSDPYTTTYGLKHEDYEFTYCAENKRFRCYETDYESAAAAVSAINVHRRKVYEQLLNLF